jgi:hypothetical protein
MINLEQFKKERLARTEQALKKAGASKCMICKIWVDNSCIIAGVCDECKHKQEELKC